MTEQRQPTPRGDRPERSERSDRPPRQDRGYGSRGGDGPRGDGPRGDGRKRPQGGQRRFPKRKVCMFCVEKMDVIDYKDVRRLRRFVTEQGKILPRRITGTCAQHQRVLTRALKRARNIALIPFKTG